MTTMAMNSIAGIGRGWPTQLATTSIGLWSHHPKIKRTSTGWWAVTGHIAGPRSWRTWEEAKGYALAKPTLEWTAGGCPNARVGQITACNCIGACHPKQIWVADGYRPL